MGTLMSQSAEQELLTVQINRVSAAIGAQAAAKVAPLGLDDRMITVLLTARSLGSPSQQEIADHARIDRTTVSKTIDRLEAEGLVNRRIDPGHRRRHQIELTTKATRTLGRVQELFDECDREFLSGLTSAEQRQLARILEKLLPASS
jgi:MarR family transcriptional regulator, lower aerobic nicotinate degradation pathway regulator